MSLLGSRCLMLIAIGLFVVACSPAPAAVPTRYVYLNGFDTCPSSPEYGRIVIRTINMYRTADVDGQNVQFAIPHGTRVVYLSSSSDGMAQIRYNGRTGYVQDMFVVPYDPVVGAQPDSSHCL